ncbi:AzlC family ABC transporter permease [Effusibacillus lacus]|uniref:Branched-chain amino acid ABC transporter permease n=1 Tax=Effusibacillus lacus TaxID=1348429 RepID=A0A292YK07_9BACL|nr:AzlC family ABC transporter permease [Effusibacillus lacus]TCS68586.1 4-azaleucine resistance transporter AzlC [Effusibacillus lacus]GAX88825.1 branched-chain amino acid ABC transporter permease [Effusibacillus lacus]
METVHSTQTKSGRKAWIEGVARALPVVLGYIPVGFAFGVLSQKAGISLWNALLMSFLVYAGSAQLIAAGLIGAGTPALSIVLTTFVVNLRHLLMSAALSPYLKKWRKRELAVFSYQLTDETFALHSVQFAKGMPGKPEVFAVNITSQASWVFGTWLGVTAGQLITDVKPLALDYALPAMFIALLLLQLRDRLQIYVALLTGLLAVGMLLLGFDRWNVIIATVLGATIGTVVELRWNRKRFS